MRDETSWARARELFLDLAELSAADREAELGRQAARDPDLAAWVRDLLRHDARPSRFGLLAPQRLGPYELVRPIGRGGMGEVHVARRVDGAFEREVAIKRLPRGVASEGLVRRFHRERQTLARLDHEYIARLLDGGTTDDGEPYLVMELVDGLPADEWAAQHDVRERLTCFLRIGEAVAHAHERGFVHRDLKPRNILVRADGAPRLLDFGIARSDLAPEGDPATGSDPLTRTGHRLFTPEYASPEQVRGEVATAQSDVFALGVLLYEFLTGVRPWDSRQGLHALERDICETDPTPPTRRARDSNGARLSADLDAIVLRCLAKRPSDRYASVAALCADVRSHLDGLPIQARRTGAFGRVARHVRRRPVHAAAGVLLVVALALAGTTWTLRRADERRASELRAAVADRIASAQLRATQGDVDAAVQEIDAALAGLRELPAEVRLEAEALSRKAVYASLRREWDATLELVDRAFRRLDGATDADPGLVARLLNSRAYALESTEAGESASQAYRAARDYALARLPAGDTLRVDALTGWAHDRLRAGDADEALANLESAVAEARAPGDPKRPILARSLNDLAVLLARRGRFADASACYREALEILAWNHGEAHPSFARVRFNLATTLYRGQEIDAAREQFERVVTVSRAQDLAEILAASLHYLALIDVTRGDHAAAVASARESLAIRATLGNEVALQETRCVLGIALDGAGDHAASRALLAELFAGPVTLPADLEVDARHRLGARLQDAGDFESARAHLGHALELERSRPEPRPELCARIEELLRRGS